VSKTALVLSPWPSLWSMKAGAGTPMAVDLFETLLDDVFEIDVVVPEAPAGHDAFPDDRRIHVHRIGTSRILPGRLLGSAVTTWRFTRRSLAIARRRRPAVVYGLSALAIPAAMLTSLALGRPSIGVLYGTFFYPTLGHPLQMLRRHEELIAFKLPVDRLVILNDGTRGDEVAERLRVPASRVRFWMHGVDVEECSTARAGESIRDHLGLPADSRLVVSTSRLVGWKRVEDVVSAFGRVVPAHPDTILVISGSGPEESKLKRLASRVLPKENIAFVGALSREVNLRLIAQADVFCSFSDFSNVGYALLEALAAGVPVVATNTGATATMVTDGANALLVAPRDTTAASQAIARLLDDAEESKHLADNARERARKEFLRPHERARLELDLLRELGVPVST